MAMREYRKGNWTVEETMILIEAKKKDDERRKLNRLKQIVTTTTTATNTNTSTSISSKPFTELRWKWVEEYCWGRNCYRSQNQCNDKWDNLMRDYKKVRDYQKSCFENEANTTSTIDTNVKSYWTMDKIERKERGLPTNMLPQIYQALLDVVDATSAAITTAASPQFLLQSSSSLVVPPPLQVSTPPLSQPLLPSPPPLLPPPPPPQPAFLSPQHLPPHPSPTLELSETSEHSQDPAELSSPAKRRRKTESVAKTTTAAAATTSATSLEEVSTAISSCATIISEAIQASVEREDRRHKELMNIQESRLRIEESKLEMNRQGFNGLTDAINRLATSIFTWANSHNKNQQGPS